MMIKSKTAQVAIFAQKKKNSQNGTLKLKLKQYGTDKIHSDSIIYGQKNSRYHQFLQIYTMLIIFSNKI